ncbi:gamma-glutamyl-gamma-aminobutyrate hydrolase family protein [Thioalkalivibrio sp. HK1]|uniref:gamma-glutamyl-gamma-aminobutyrate hydrolase family protein n=1 Tax=Thioalkalivibrio sp. HK1 TaxID=1469245 RepID=UPI0004B629DD|nr:gamma-glutamyl-gamma-aminobutyrate hydrolase family protein [Thioalkalivibrio sp. HK1]
MSDADRQGIAPVITPVIGIIACRHESDRRMYQAVQEKYISAVNVGMNAIPLLFPCIGNRIVDSPLLEMLDGVLFTGSLSNVHPRHYGPGVDSLDTLHDTHRDETALPLIRRAVEKGVPLLAICRGFQEVNVAFGGSLDRRVHERPGGIDHHPDENASIDEQYAPAHRIMLTENGLLHRLFETCEIEVNSLHHQGIDRLAPDLIVEATAPDGLIEAVRIEGAPAFALAVQWHPEWRAIEDRASKIIFEAFAQAARQANERRKGGGVRNRNIVRSTEAATAAMKSEIETSDVRDAMDPVPAESHSFSGASPRPMP